MSRLFVEHLTVIDCAYLDAARGLVGESWIVDLELEGDLDEQSMVLDFGEVKRRLKRAIDAAADHRLLVPARAPELVLSSEDPAALQLLFRADAGAIEHVSPALAVRMLDVAEISADALADGLRRDLAPMLPSNVHGLHLHLRNEVIEGAWYHYVHGLKKHCGACQRIAHGHRSRLQVFVDGVRDSALEQQVATAWTDIYLGTREDLVARGNGRLRFAYTAPEGHYQLALPEHCVDLIDADSTVENIAALLHARLVPQRPGAALTVRAYEGVMKGAIAR